MGCFNRTGGDNVELSEGEPVDCPEIEMGHMYHEGLGVERDYAKAMEWYLKAAESNAQFPDGHPESHYYVGNMYYRGHGVPKNDARAVMLFRKSAMLGVAVAQVATAYMLYFGHGCRANEEEALGWLEKAARRGRPDAQYLLGDSLAARRPVKAWGWYLRAVENPGLDDTHRAKARVAMEMICRKLHLITGAQLRFSGPYWQ